MRPEARVEIFEGFLDDPLPRAFSDRYAPAAVVTHCRRLLLTTRFAEE